LSPKGARRFLQHCIPIRRMYIYSRGLDRHIMNCSLDVMTNALYPRINAFVSFPPLAVSKNEKTASIPSRKRAL
jgi:glycosyl transferase, family 25